MKKLVWLSVLFVFLYTHQSFAAPSLAVSATGTVISATLSNIPATTDTFQLLLQTTPFATGGYTGTATPAVLGSDPTQQAPVVIPPSTLGTATWSLGPYLANTTYYVEVVQIPSFQNSATEKAVYATNPTSITTQAATIPFLPLTASVSGKTIIISGKIDTTKISNFTTTAFSPTLEYSASPATNTTTGALSSPINPPLKPDSSVGSDGSYTWTVSQSGFTPSTTYYFQQTVADSAGNSKIDIVVNVDSSSGNIVAAGVTGSTLSSSTYTLLSGGFPGLVSIPSAQQCATEQATATAQGKTPPICSVNDLLNYAMQLLIGLCGVVLVLRLMYEGYIYMVTDVPFLKASSKSGFMTALLGLLLALTSYVILNTINPKLVSETVNVTPLAIGVEETSLDSKTFQTITGETLQTESSYLPMVKTISQQQGIDPCIVEATIQEESDWNAADIGCDEDTTYAGVPSRTAFLQSGITYNGTTFTPTSDSTSSQKDGACKFNASLPGYGLDWRFSKGGGLMQVTLFPSGYKTTAWYNGVKNGGSYWQTRTTPYTGWETLIKPEANITKGIQILKTNMSDCNQNIEQAFREYEGGSCSSSSTLIDATVAKKMSVYTSCEQGS